MTRFQAVFIKYLRIRCDCTWRVVHSNYQRRYVPKEEWWENKVSTDFKNRVIATRATDEESVLNKLKEALFATPDGNQISGMKLCEEAQNLLGEDWEDY